ncbi:hypothetical protein HYC85_031599, partial [Camellia sinensis]
FLSLEEIDESEYGLEIPKPERENKKERTTENKNEKKRKQSEVDDELGGEVEAVSEEKDNKVKRKKKKKKKKRRTRIQRILRKMKNQLLVKVSDPKDDTEGDSVDEAEYYAWNELRLLPLLMKAIYSLGFKKPTPIQKACIPAATHQGKVDFISIMLYLDHCFGKNVIGAAETGSGKTLAFGLPIFQRLLEEREKADNMFAEKGEAAEKIAPSRLLRALVITPTRELALQVTDHLNEVAKGTNFRVVPIVGGMSTEKQERLLKARPKIVVGTPGRLWELMSGGELHLIEVSANANYRLVYMYKGFMSALHQHSIIIVTLCCVH